MVNFGKLINVPKDKIQSNGSWLFSKLISERLNIEPFKKKTLYPIIVEEKQDYFDLIFGYEVLQSISDPYVPVIIADMDDLYKGLINLEFIDSEFKNSGKIIVCARYFDKVLSKGNREKEFFGIFDTILNKKEISNLLEWVSLPEDFDDILINENVSIDVVEDLKKFSYDEIVYIIPFFQNIKWGKNKSKIFLELLYKLKKRDKVNVKTILTPISHLLEKDLSPNDKIQNILNYLRDNCFPNIRSLEKEFMVRVFNLTDKKRIKITHSNGFELDEIYLEVTLDDSYTIKELIEDLKNKSSEWDEFYTWYKSKLNTE